MPRDLGLASAVQSLKPGNGHVQHHLGEIGWRQGVVDDGREERRLSCTMIEVVLQIAHCWK